MGSPVVCLLGHSALDRLAYRLLLKQELDLDVQAESSFAAVAVWSALRAEPSLVIANADHPTSEARETLQMIRRLRREVSILVLSAAVEPMVVSGWADCEINGYAVKDAGLEELKLAVRALLDHRRYFSPGVREALEAKLTSADRPKLSRREAELLPLLARGMTLQQAASTMTVSYKTADSYRTSLMRKLGVRDRVGLARYAIRERIVEP